MNLPQFQQAINRAMTEYEDACVTAKERMLKAFAAARQELFEDVEEAPPESDYGVNRR
jgi:hypothetical protein